MKGLELSRGYFEEFGLPMLKKEFPDILPFLAAGFVGSGSEHYGYDDETSADHDFEPGFCIFLPDKNVINERQEFLLERAYSKLPKEYCGVKRLRMSPVGGNRHGVKRTADYFLSAVGESDGNLSVDAWLHIPDYALAEAVNGEIYFDNYGEFTRIRERIQHMPGDVLLKRLAGNILIMAQAGQYNFQRCLKHNEPEAAQLACNEFINAAMKTAFLLNGKYMPYYKWSFRALREIESSLADRLSSLLMSGKSAGEKYEIIEEISSFFISELQKKEITKAVCGDLEKHAYSVNDMIRDGSIRNLHILTAI